MSKTPYNEIKKLMDGYAKILLDTFKNCRTDMHEPDANLKVEVFGDNLDNAFGDIIDFENLKNQEFVIRVSNDDGEVARFNLASLIAMARFGAKIHLALQE